MTRNGGKVIEPIPLTVRQPLVSAGQALSGPHEPVRSLYIHVPFCFHKCHYCDFYSFVDTRDQQEAFVTRLIQELEALAPHAGAQPLRTIFVGGGTPSLLRVPLWERLLAAIDRSFDLSLIRARAADAEFTVECNPETVTPELLNMLLAGGVDRISMGAQSFNPAHLKTLERWHEPASVARSADLARRAGVPRLSLDLIFAIPGQTLDDWREDLRQALALGTDHLSCYNLTYEPNTAMTQRLRLGEFEPLDDETEAAMYTLTTETLAGAGLHRYEVSNYARPGQQSRHNLAYWRNQQWLAAGPSASAHVGGSRWKNVPRLPDYLESADRFGGLAPVVDLEEPDRARAWRERVMMGLRLAEGLDLPSVRAAAEAASPGAAHRLDKVAAQLRADDLLSPRANRLVLTDAGFLCADHVAAELMACMP